MIQQTPKEPNWREEFVSGILAITQRKALVVVVFLSVVCISGIKWLSLEPFYEASATIVLLPREKPILDIAAQSESLESSDETARRAQASSLTLPPNPDLYITLMHSGSLCERISQRLAPAYVLSASQVRHGIHVSSEDNGLLRITCQASDPRASALIASYVIQECKEASKSIERQLILQQTGYLDGAVDKLRDRVNVLTARVNRVSGEFGVSDPELAAARSIARLRRLDESQIKLETQLDGLRVHRTSLDPLVTTLRAELESVYIAHKDVSMNFCGLVSEQEYSSKLAEWNGLHQELNQTQDMHMSLAAKRDLFKIRAEQPSGNIAVIREPSIPGAPAGPSKRRAVSLALIIGTGFSLIACVIADQVSRMNQHEVGRALLRDVVVSCTPRILLRKVSP